MYPCLHVYMYACNVCTHAHSAIYSHINVYIDMTLIYVSIHMHICVYVYVCMHR